jgi:hypothetical protein
VKDGANLGQERPGGVKDGLAILDRIMQSQETKSEALKAKQRRLLQSLKDGIFAKRAQDLGESIRRTANGGHWAERTC